MHICFITNEYPKEGFPHGGVGSFVKTMAEALVKEKYNVSVVGMNYSDKDEEETQQGIAIYRIKKSKIKGISWFFNAMAINKTIKKIHKENPIDIVETAELGLAFMQKIKGIKYVIRLHGGHHFFAEAEKRKINKWKGFQEKRSFKKADAFIAVSEYVKQHTAQYLSYNDKPVVTIFNPINTDVFNPVPGKVEENTITFAGTVCEKKGVRQLIQAFPLVKKEVPQAVLNIYGRDWFYPDGSSYVEMLRREELPQIAPYDQDVIFHGSIAYQQIPEVYAKAEVCVFPSHMETLGLVAPEAMAMEKSVIFTEMGPGPEVIVPYETGLLCNPYEPKDIAEKIIWLFKNKEKAKNIAKQARTVAVEKFSLPNSITENIAFYSKIKA
ncbi:glycosyltransferase family 1 protein [Flavobacterium sediminis]|uniref:Glycosyltransferase family 1 protein n=1 Tax=Flavobacterium sediminis TaxID=2201181 RepID=A0A2U8QS78_9FLAO|nr:glycosyltransferase family 4 protein [Flavobacterium sediminis]AWM13013.1 glycosyltransferase family 1 protein [Flavobacterium sediminis]